MPAAPPIDSATIAKAMTEITSKKPEDIEGATAIIWGARAIAAWSLYSKAKAEGSPYDLFWFKEATAYKHEALEHAGWGPTGLLEALKTQLAEVP